MRYRIRNFKIGTVSSVKGMYGTTVFPVVLYGRESWSHIEEHRLRVFENRVLRRIFGPKRVEHSRNGEDCIMRSFTICKTHQILLA